MEESDNITSLECLAEIVEGKLILRIPLAEGGSELMASARGISSVQDGFLEIHIPNWLAEKLGISEGTRVVVDNENGKLNVTPQHGEAN